jgi:hypothetical protein
MDGGVKGGEGLKGWGGKEGRTHWGVVGEGGNKSDRDCQLDSVCVFVRAVEDVASRHTETQDFSSLTCSNLRDLSQPME